MRLLTIPSSDTTSLNIIVRCMSVAAAAVKKGHSVGVLAPNCLTRRFKIPAQFFEYPVPPTINRVNLTAPPIKKYGDYAELIGLTQPQFIRECLDTEESAITEFAPDVIYSDLNLTASISARRFDLRLASLCNLAWTPPYLLDESFEDDQLQAAPFNSLLGRYNLPPIRDLTDLIFLFSDAKIVPSCPEFEQFDPSISGIEYCGYLYSEELETRTEQPPRETSGHHVLVYMGIGDIDLPLMTSTLPPAFDGTQYRVTVVIGDFYPEVPKSTRNVEYVRFLPLQQTLRNTDLVIFHGGSGLVATCLLQGIPGLMFPCGVYERVFHAETMAKVKAGIVLPDLADFSVSNLRHYTQEILNGDYAKNAKQFGDYLRSLGGPDRAVEILTRLVPRCDTARAVA